MIHGILKRDRVNERWTKLVKILGQEGYLKLNPLNAKSMIKILSKKKKKMRSLGAHGRWRILINGILKR